MPDWTSLSSKMTHQNYRSVRKVVTKLNRMLATNRNEVDSNFGRYISDPVLGQKSSGRPFKGLKKPKISKFNEILLKKSKVSML